MFNALIESLGAGLGKSFADVGGRYHVFEGEEEGEGGTVFDGSYRGTYWGWELVIYRRDCGFSGWEKYYRRGD